MNTTILTTPKKQGGGKHTRYFYNMKVRGQDAGVYRSRHSTVTGVLSEFHKNGQKVTRCEPVFTA